MGEPPLVVDPLVSKAKLDREVSELLSLGLRKRGWILESTTYPTVRVTFVTGQLFPPIASTVELDFHNYNLWPPSVRFVHPTTLLPAYLPGLRKGSNGEQQKIVISGHPITKEPFLCLPGVCEYHSHPQHDGDSWDLHRYSGEGTLFFLLDKIYTYCIGNIRNFTINASFSTPMMQYTLEAQP